MELKTYALDSVAIDLHSLDGPLLTILLYQRKNFDVDDYEFILDEDGSLLDTVLKPDRTFLDDLDGSNDVTQCWVEPEELEKTALILCPHHDLTVMHA